MDKFRRKTKGAISIFLALVLMPLMSVASIFVDMSRIELAQSMAASAGDLTLNTALSNYDSELKTIYGLFATAQNMDEMMESLEDYYRQSIVAAGVDEDIAADFAGNVMDLLKEETGTDDLMNIQLSGLDVEIPKGAHLGNPAILKSQIVEFMKYRAPVNLGMGILDSILNMKNLSKQMDVVENKNAFYEQHQDMLGHVETAWKEIQEYQYKDAAGNTGFPTGSYIGDKARDLDAQVDKLKAAAKDTVLYLYDVDSFEGFSSSISVSYACPECGESSTKNATSCGSCEATWSLKTGNQVWKTKWDGGSTKTVEPAPKYKSASVKDVLTAYNKVRSRLNDIKKFENDANDICNTYSDGGSDPVKQIYKVRQFNNAVNSKKSYVQSVKDLVQDLVNLNSALMTCEDEDLTTATMKKGSDGTYTLSDTGSEQLYAQAITQLKHMDVDSGYFRNFRTIVNKINSYVESCNQIISEKKSSVKTSLTNARATAKTYYEKIDEKIKNLDAAITQLESAKGMLDGTQGSYKSAQTKWKNSATNLGDDTMGQRDLDELNGLKEIITSERVGALITRLRNARTSLETVRKEIEKYEICGTSWKDIPASPDHKTMVELIKNCPGKNFDSKIKNIVPESTKSYSAVVEEIQATVKVGQIPTTWDKNNHPNLAPDAPSLYAWMYNNYYDAGRTYTETTTAKETNKADDDLTNATGNIEKSVDTENGHKTAAEVKESAGTKTKREIKPYLEASNGLPSTRWGGEKQELQKGAIASSAEEMLGNEDNDNFLKLIMNLAMDVGRDLRDNLYVSEYIMTMFSYDTMEAEIFDKNNKDSDRKMEAFYEQQDGAYKAKDAFAEYAAQMQTQTNIPITPDMNYLYGEEVEYILYGDGGKTSAYETIFALRFAFNTVYAFTDAEINNVTLSMATALFGTPPLTPLIPLAKSAMTIALALAESGWDLNELNKGKAIPLIKNRDTWVMSPTGIAGVVKDEAVSIAKNATTKVVDKGYAILNDALNATSEELDAMIQSGTGELEKLTTAALESSLGSLENYANTALQKAVELCNQVNQEYMLKPLEDMKPDGSSNFVGDNGEKAKVVAGKLKDWLNAQTGDTEVVKEVKEIAVNYLVDNGKIAELFEAIEKQATMGTQLQSGSAEVTDYLGRQLKDIKASLNVKIRKVANQTGTALANMKNSLVSEINAAAEEGADKLKSVLSDKLDDCFNKIPTNDKAPTGAANGVVSSLLSWRYSDYLRIFVVVGLFANEELMLLRIADMVERNMQHKNNEAALVTSTETVTKSRFFGLWKYQQEKKVTSISKDAYSLSKAYTYVKLNAHLQVKPLLMTLPFMAETVENELTGYNWYEVQCTSMMGY